MPFNCVFQNLKQFGLVFYELRAPEVADLWKLNLQNCTKIDNSIANMNINLCNREQSKNFG